MPSIREIANKQIVKYNSNGLYCSWQERVGPSPNDGLSTRPICFICDAVMGEWNKEFRTGEECRQCKRKREYDALQTFAENNQQGEH
jgi:hypothetical protein